MCQPGTQRPSADGDAAEHKCRRVASRISSGARRQPILEVRAVCSSDAARNASRCHKHEHHARRDSCWSRRRQEHWAEASEPGLYQTRCSGCKEASRARNKRSQENFALVSLEEKDNRSAARGLSKRQYRPPFLWRTRLLVAES